MGDVLQRLLPYNLHCIIVNDGSDAETTRQLAALAQCYNWVTLIEHQQNRGKGNAVLSALREAQRQGFSHGLQVDADGQHHLADIPRLLDEAHRHPDALISGQPIYDQSIPKSRFYARYITHIWVWIETLSLSIKDSMCGFRVYPIQPTLMLADTVTLGQRMDFDTEVMVRLYWLNVPIRFISTKVIYPADGLSHFNVWRDNLRISWMHSRLFLAMLAKLPSLIKRKFQSAPPAYQPQHWSQEQERQGLWGMRLMLKCYRLFGRRVFNLLLYPVIGFYWLTGKKQRRASQNYLAQLKQFAWQNKRPLGETLNSFRHFMRFGAALLDKLAAWLGDIHLDQIDFPAKTQCLAQMHSGRGTLILASHLGNIELCRALGELTCKVKVNALVFTRHAARFNQLMQELNPNATLNLIQIDRLGVDTAILLQQKLAAGEWVAIVGDRTPVSSQQRSGEQRLIWADFLGRPAPFPVGPFVLAAALRCPVFLMFGLKAKGRFKIHFEPFADPLLLPRATRQQALQQSVEHYAQRLEEYCLQSPLDWFNFYDFWQADTAAKHQELNQ